VGKHLLRLASTRAIARALRTFTNIGYTCLEELADLNDVLAGNDAKASKSKPVRQPAKKTRASNSAKGKSGPAKKQAVKSEAVTDNSDISDNKKLKGNGSGDKASAQRADKSRQPIMSEAQKRAIYNLSRRRGISVEDLEAMAVDAYGVAVESLTSKDASSFIRNLQQAA
jgi:hypothetical protein